MNNFAIRSVCPCGWWDTPAFGSEFISRSDYPVCPKCGVNAAQRKLRSARVVRTSGKRWWNKASYKLEFKE